MSIPPVFESKLEGIFDEASRVLGQFASPAALTNSDRTKLRHSYYSKFLKFLNFYQIEPLPKLLISNNLVQCQQLSFA
jgi:hypothetical protein